MTRMTIKGMGRGFKYVLLSTVLGGLLSAGCSESPQTTNDDSVDTSIFAGCYTVSHDEPAQIRISEQAGKWVMQMKEPVGAAEVWDEPTELEALTRAEVPKYFSIDPQHVDAMLARPDKVMVMAHVKTAYANIDPLLDSEYLVYIYRGANTIFKVDCDSVNVDLLHPHGKSNIVIDNVDAPQGAPTGEMPNDNIHRQLNHDDANTDNEADTATEKEAETSTPAQ